MLHAPAPRRPAHRRRRHHLVEQLLVDDRTGSGDHQVGRGVPAREELRHLVTPEPPDRLGRAQGLPAQWVAGEERLVEGDGCDIVGVLACRGQLLEDHLTLRIHILGAQGRPLDHIQEQIHRHGGVGRRNGGVERRVLVGGEGVHVTPDAVHRDRDVTGTTAIGPLEQQVFEEVRCSGEDIGLVA
ncbi:MAG: hypothetical protein M5U19_13205 [Microthrixaceae bacterium]|nr:hypothetical protein [Microthrixaceae bacterium]